MTTLSPTRRAIGGGVAALAVAALALGGGTYATFSSTHAGPSGTLAAGTLTVDVGGFATTDLFNATISPGQVVQRPVTITNTGGISGRLTEQYVMIGNENGCNPGETAAGGCSAGGGNLQESDQLQVSRDGTTYTPVNAMTAPNWMPPATLAPGGSVTQQFWFKLPDNAHNNRVQSDLLRIQSIVTLTQS